MSYFSQLIFKVSVQTQLDEVIKIVGNIPELGEWNADNALLLGTETGTYPEWSNSQPLVVPRGTKVEFKFVKVRAQQVQWETLPQNRKYRARYLRVVLRAEWNNYEGFESIEKQFKSSVHLTQSALRDCKKKKFSRNFNPYEQDSSEEGSDSDDNSSRIFGDSFNVKPSLEFSSSEEDEVETVSTKIRKEEIKNNMKRLPRQKSKIEGTQNLALLYSHYIPNPKLQQLVHNCPIENDILYEVSEETLHSLSDKDTLVITTFFLPFTMQPKGNSYTYNLFEFSFNYHLYSSFSQLNCQKRWIGIPVVYENDKLKQEFTDDEKRSLETFLLSNCNAIPVFLDRNDSSYFNKEVYQMLYQPIMDNEAKLNLHVEYKEEMFENFQRVTESFYIHLDKIIQTHEQVLSVIADHRLVLLPKFISQNHPRSPISIFYNHHFPSYDTFVYLPFYKEIINAFLLANVVCFSNYSTASNFINIITQQFHFDFISQKGSLLFRHLGREIQLRLRSPGIDLSVGSSQQTSPELDFLFQSPGQQKTIVAGVDILGVHQGVDVKLKLLKRFVTENLDLVRIKNVKIFQVIMGSIEENPNSWAIETINTLSLEINQIVYPNQNDWCVKIINLTNHPQKSHIHTIQVLFRHAHIYLQSHNSGKHDQFLLQYMYVNRVPKTLISNSSCYNRALTSIQSYSIYNYQDFSSQFMDIINSCSEVFTERAQNMGIRIQSDKQTLVKNQTLQWLYGLLIDLKKNHSQMQHAEVSITLQDNLLRKVAHSPKFTQLRISQLQKNFQKKRLIVIEFHTLLVDARMVYDSSLTSKAENCELQCYYKIDGKILNYLNELSKKCPVYIFSATSMKILQKSLQFCPELNLVAENGFHYKLSDMKSWEQIFNIDLHCMDQVYRLMQSFVQKGEGSTLEARESSLIWRYGLHFQEFGRKLANDLMENLHIVQESFRNLEIVQYKNQVEVRPVNLNKGILLDLIIQHEVKKQGKLDSLACIGRPSHDEDMFAINRLLKLQPNTNYFVDNPKLHFICNQLVPSFAQFYFKKESEIIDILSALSL